MGDLTDAFDKTTKAAQLGDIDAAVVASGRNIAQQIDYAVEYLEGQDVTKALYLTPHLMNVLKEMLATPAARAAVKDAKPKGAGPATMKDEVGEKRSNRGWRSA